MSNHAYHGTLLSFGKYRNAILLYAAHGEHVLAPLGSVPVAQSQ